MINLYIDGLPGCKVFSAALNGAGQKLRNHLHRTHPFAFKCSVCLFCGNRSKSGAPGGAHNEHVCEWLSGWLFAQWSACFSMPRWVSLSQLFPITAAAESARAAFLHRRALRVASAHPQRGHIVPASRLLFFTGGESGQRRGVLFFVMLSGDLSVSSLFAYTARVSHPCASQQQQPRVSSRSAEPDSTA